MIATWRIPFSSPRTRRGGTPPGQQFTWLDVRILAYLMEQAGHRVRLADFKTALNVQPHMLIPRLLRLELDGWIKSRIPNPDDEAERMEWALLQPNPPILESVYRKP